MMDKLIAQTNGAPRRLLLALLASAFAMLAFSSVASAEATFDFSFGSTGVKGGQFNEPAGIAQNLSTGNLYVADRQNNRIQEFTENGEFLQAWGFDVVESGVDNKEFVDEVQTLKIEGIAGTFKLSYGEDTTPSIAYNAAASTVQEAINKLPSIEAVGSVSVSGGPGDATGSTPYFVTFEGGLAHSDVEQLSIDRSQLALPVGTELTCQGVNPYLRKPGEGHYEFQWLRNGQPIEGATSTSYTTTAADSGKPVQCEVEAVYDVAEPTVYAWGTNSDYTLVGSVPATPPPIPPAEIKTSGPTLHTPGSGGTLTCEAGTWQNSPSDYTYQWFLRGKAVTSPVTKAATTDQHTFTEEDVGSTALIQCKVTGSNAGGSATKWGNLVLTEPQPNIKNPLFYFETPRNEVSYPAGASAVATQVNGGPVFEICKANTNDVCKAGVPGPSMGQFSQPRGVAVDNSPGGQGAVYVGDDKNYRIQKLSEGGAPILEVGEHVDQITRANLCVVASGDACLGAEQSEDPLMASAFGGWPCSGGCNNIGTPPLGFDELGNTVAVDPNNGNFYATDFLESGETSWEGRLEGFGSDGHFIGQTQQPVALLNAWPTSVAVSRESKVMVTVAEEAKDAVEQLPESLFTPEGTRRSFGEREQVDAGHHAHHVAGDPNHDKIWVVDRNSSDFEGFQNAEHVCGNETDESYPRRALMAFDHEGHLLDCTVPQGPGAITSSGGVTVTENGVRAFVTLRSDNKIKAFKLPQPSLPTAGDSFVELVTQHTAQAHGEVAAGFEPTEWGIEYGTSPCTTPGACTKTISPQKVFGLKTVSVEIPLEGLQPATKYYFRLVATNRIGTTTGPEHTFRTYQFVDLRNDKCPNVLVRKQTGTSGELDCRAYELASAGFAGGYDVISDLAPDQTPFEGFPEADGKVLYAVKDGGIPGAGFPTNHGPDPYVAVRDEQNERWVTKYMGIPSNGTPSLTPFSSTPLAVDGFLSTFAFGGSDICNPCFEDGSSGIPVHLPDGSLVQGLTGAQPDPTAEPEGYVRKYMSDDGSHLVFGSKKALEEDGHAGELAIYDRNLKTGVTHVVSKTASGETMKEEGEQIGELDISRDGSRILFGKLVSKDATGMHWKLYMNVGDSGKSVELTPGATEGVVYDGMSADGTRVFFTTREKLVGDTDTSADLFEVEVPTSGAPSPPKLISGASSDSCNPIGNPNDWNVPSGSGKCDAVGLAGGAGVAADGTVYFLSPQLLDGSQGEEDAANLYVVRAGTASPKFVATIDGGAQKPPPPPLHPVVNAELITGLSNPESLAVDQNNGDIYVEEQGTNTVLRYTAAGVPKAFTEGPEPATNKLPGQKFSSQGKGEIAVDSSGGVMNGNLYVTTLGNTIKVYSNTGKEIGTLTGFTETCGVAVENSTGAVYVADPKASTLYRFMPESAPSPAVSNVNFSVTKLTILGQLCNLSADNAGQVYASSFPNGPPHRFNASEFTAQGPYRSGAELKLGSVTHLTYVDPSTNELYVNTGSKVIVLNSSGKKLKEFGSGSISGYSGIAVNGGQGAGQAARAHHAYAVNGEKIVEFGIEPDTYEPVDNPAIAHAVSDHDTHYWTDFQTSANGRYALFTTLERLKPGYDNGKFLMVYRYDTSNGELSCASCIPTEARPSADNYLPSEGLGITNDGRAFFNSKDPLAVRDTNKKLDAYEWAPMREGVGGCEVEIGCQALISTGYSSYPSSMLGVSNDGTDAFFFTREVLVGQDHNGQTEKIYDARAGGGFFELPHSPPCSASDECHGPSSQAAPAPAISTHELGGGNARTYCKKRFVLRHGRCVRKPKHSHRKRKRHHRNHHRAAGHGRRASR